MWNKINNLILSIKPYAFEMTISILGALLKQFSILGAAGSTSYIVGSLIEQNKDFNKGFWIGFLVFCILLRAISAFAESTLAHDVAFRVIRDFRLNIFKKIGEISPAYTLRKKTGQLGQTLVSDVEVLELFLAHTFNSFIVAMIITAGVFVFFARLSFLMAILFLVCAAIMFGVPYSMRKKSGSQGEAVREDLAESNSKIIESIQGLREIVTLNSVKTRREEIITSTEKLYDAQLTYGRRKGTESMLNSIISGAFMVVTMLLAASMVISGKQPFSVYTVFVMISSVALGPVGEAALVAQELGLVLASADRIQTILKTKPAIKDEGTIKEIPKHALVEFKNVQFAYEEGQEAVLRGVDFMIRPGETVALVGESGAGKTTCANLLLRYWDPNAGKITVNGLNLKNYSMEALRGMVSAVQQDPFLFHTSIRENIRLGRMEAEFDEIIKVAKDANADNFIRNLPNGYDTIVGEHGYRLSGGQRQRISIARAILCDSPIVIFDEAVSNLDTENEMEIQETLRKLMKDKTVIMIAHRLSTIITADKVIMLKNGKVATCGKHAELLEKSEAYRQLISSQMS